MTDNKLMPCRECGKPCEVVPLTGPHIQGECFIWACSDHEKLGGKCPDDMVYLTEEAWNTRFDPIAECGYATRISRPPMKIEPADPIVFEDDTGAYTRPTTDKLMPTACHHLMHLPSGKCLGCGEQHQPLADYQPGDDEKYTQEHLAEAARPTTDVSTDVLVALIEALDPHRYIEGIGSQKWIDACHNIAPHAYKLRDQLKALQRSNTELKAKLDEYEERDRTALRLAEIELKNTLNQPKEDVRRY